MSIFSRILHAGEGRKLKSLQTVAAPINALEPELEKLSDADLAQRTKELRSRSDQGEPLDDLLVEAFATVREASKRVLGQRHFDVQLMGGAALHLGWIAEMKTGEGKTLVATLPCYLNGLSGRSVHVVTVNDYLARRDAEWMGGIHKFLGLEVGLIQAEMDAGGPERRAAYAADITYGTNNEFGFDYLRDNMAMTRPEMVQRGHHYAIVDEVDSILIDEARTPLIISGRVEEAGDWYRKFAQITRGLRRDRDYEVDEAKHTVAVTEDGVGRVEHEIGVENLYDHVNTNLVHHLLAALKAKELYKREVEYIVQNGEVLIVDEFTGRILHGRRYSEGLHQAIEAKEGVRIKEENQTLATITLQNYFRMYDKLAGMTGTAVTEASEFAHIYKLECVPIPTNVTVARADKADFVYKSENAKFNALVDDIVERYERGQPVLVGTVSVEKSEKLSRYLDKRGIPHSVLNAKYHEKEAEIIAQAGRLKAVTVATNMAGRGVDIQLGGNPDFMAKDQAARELAESGMAEKDADYEEVFGRTRSVLLDVKRRETGAERERVIDLGGLYVLGTERHESRRIDNQLRGRSGRQGDPGESRFYLSLEDDLMRLFAADRIDRIMTLLKVPEDVPIEAKMVSKAIERAQSQVESRNFEIRKNILKYDDVMNKQRVEVYKRRQQALEGADMRDDAILMVERAVSEAAERFCGDSYPEEWDLDGLLTHIRELYPTKLDVDSLGERKKLTVQSVTQAFLDEALDLYEKREREFGSEVFRDLERRVLLSIIDYKWREHLYEMDYLLEGINLRAMGQQDPLVAYTNDGFAMFREMEAGVREEFVRYMFHIQAVRDDQRQRRTRLVQGGRSRVAAIAASAGGNGQGEREPEEEPVKEQARSEKVPRNAPCPCGSGKKYKFCHGR